MLPLGIIEVVNAEPTAASGITEVHHSLHVVYRTLYRRTECSCGAHISTRRLDSRIYGEVRHWKNCSQSMSEVLTSLTIGLLKLAAFRHKY